MKLQRWEIFCMGATALALVLLCAAAIQTAPGQTARLTSDASKSQTAAFPPLPAGIYQPPQPSVVIVWHTNVEPLTVRVTVSSNVVPVWRWVDSGVVYTNCGTPLSSNVISISTNEVKQ